MKYHAGGEVGPALGAARLAWLASGGVSLGEACPPPPLAYVVEPEADLAESLEPRRALFKQLYGDLTSAFAKSLH